MILFPTIFGSLKWLSPIMFLGLSGGQREADYPLVAFPPSYNVPPSNAPP